MVGDVPSFLKSNHPLTGLSVNAKLTAWPGPLSCARCELPSPSQKWVSGRGRAGRALSRGCTVRAHVPGRLGRRGVPGLIQIPARPCRLPCPPVPATGACRTCLLPGSQHPPGSIRRGLVAPDPPSLPTPRATCPASVSLSSKGVHRKQGVNRGTAQTYTVSRGRREPSTPGSRTPAPPSRADSALPARWPPPPPAGAPWGTPARMCPAGCSSSAAVGGSVRPRPAPGSERREGREVGRGLASGPAASSSPAGPVASFPASAPHTGAHTRTHAHTHARTHARAWGGAGGPTACLRTLQVCFSLWLISGRRREGKCGGGTGVQGRSDREDFRVRLPDARLGK